MQWQENLVPPSFHQKADINIQEEKYPDTHHQGEEGFSSAHSWALCCLDDAAGVLITSLANQPLSASYPNSPKPSHIFQVSLFCLVATLKTFYFLFKVLYTLKLAIHCVNVFHLHI